MRPSIGHGAGRAHAPVAPAAVWPQVSGPYVTLATVAALAMLNHMVAGLPDPTAVVLMAVVYGAFAGGERAGLVSAAMAFAYFAGTSTAPGTVFGVESGQGARLLLLGAALPAMVLMVARLKRRAERAFELQAEHERMRELDQLKTQFLNNAAHELRTPLTPIVLQLRVLRGGDLAALDERQQRALEMLDRNIARLNTLVQDLLEVSKMQAGKLSLERRLVDLDHIVLEAAESFREPAKAAGLDIDARLAGGLVADADAKRLMQVLFNLLSNAVKFTPPGGRISLETRAVEGCAEVRVRDTGRGLGPEQRARLFQPFSQVHDPGLDGQRGSGLGLYICRGIVEQHGGRIWAASEGPGKGSTFTFALPTASAADAPVHGSDGMLAHRARQP